MDADKRGNGMRERRRETGPRFARTRRGIAHGWLPVLLLAVIALSAASRLLLPTAAPVHPVPTRVLLVVAVTQIRAAEALGPDNPRVRLDWFELRNAPPDAFTDPRDLRNRYALRDIAAGQVIRRDDI